MAAESNNLEEILRPFYQRASEAEARLMKLEASLAKNNKESGNKEQLKLVDEVQRELDNARAEKHAEMGKRMNEVEHLTAENAKLRYRILHLVRALEQANSAAK